MARGGGVDLVGDLELELLLDRHDHLDGVQAVQPQILLEMRLGGPPTATTALLGLGFRSKQRNAAAAAAARGSDGEAERRMRQRIAGQSEAAAPSARAPRCRAVRQGPPRRG